MLSRLKAHFNNFDWLIMAALVLLISFGLLEIYSVALGRGGLDLLNFRKQLLFTIAGLVVLILFSFIDYHYLRSLSHYIFWAGALILILVLFFGDVSRGTRGWFSFNNFALQPVEFVKIILIIFLADYFSRLATRVKSLKHFLVSLLSTLIFAFLVLLQPDFGAAMVLLAIWLVIIIAASFDIKYFIVTAVVSLLVFTSAWFFFFQDYQKNRILGLVHPEQTSQDAKYNVTQSIIAIGSGGLIGKGLGFGSQSQLKFLPEAQNDFIFAVIAEELGFFGVALLLLFFALLFWRIIRIIPQLNNDFAIYFLIGAVGLIFIQMFINIGMNLGIVPVVGLTLPFISSGGSSLLSLMIMMGIVQNIIIKTKTSY